MPSPETVLAVLIFAIAVIFLLARHKSRSVPVPEFTGTSDYAAFTSSGGPMIGGVENASSASKPVEIPTVISIPAVEPGTWPEVIMTGAGGGGGKSEDADKLVAMLLPPDGPETAKVSGSVGHEGGGAVGASEPENTGSVTVLLPPTGPLPKPKAKPAPVTDLDKARKAKAAKSKTVNGKKPGKGKG